jgi:cytochrome c5
MQRNASDRVRVCTRVALTAIKVPVGPGYLLIQCEVRPVRAGQAPTRKEITMNAPTRCTSRNHLVRPRKAGWGPACTALLLIAAVAVGAPVQAQIPHSGKQVVEQACGQCHVTGEQGAPKIGDRKAWAPRASQGLTSLTRHALEGIRNMPAHGGAPSLSDLEIGRAIAYMVNQSGGTWVEPASARDLATARGGEQLVAAKCTQCHQEGKDGAPRIGDRAAWTERMKRGLDPLVASAIKGHGGMPARGGMADASDPEIRSAVVHMFNKSVAQPVAERRAAAPAK